ncbi:hypothetical protein BJ944DRAFT_268872 [Cunninghamella echinulata]|nr:hypothetical protein BJ944DRAFT_268872 [Cunninghamella echinulata]
MSIESSNENSETVQINDQSSSWLTNLFQPFVLTTNDLNEQKDDRGQFLGVCGLRTNSHGSLNVAFFLVPYNPSYSCSDTATTINSTIHQLYNNNEIVTKNTSNSSSISAYSLFDNNSNNNNNMKYNVVMSLDTQTKTLSKHQHLYLFPSNALVETVNENAPYELFCSFHIDDNQLVNSINKNQHSKIEKQTSYTSLQHLSTKSNPSGIKSPSPSQDTINENRYVIHLSLFNIPKDLYLAIKQTVADFEVYYNTIIKLMKIHTEGVSNRQKELLAMEKVTRTKKSSESVMTVESKATINRGKRKSSHNQNEMTRNNNVSMMKTKSVDEDNKIVSKHMNSISTPNSRTLTSHPNSTTTVFSSTSTSSILTTTNHRNNSANGNGRKCSYCGSKTTPMWRRGPEGAGTLCNACGVKWKHGKILCDKPLPSAKTNANDSKASTVSSHRNNSNNNTAVKDQQKKRKQHNEIHVKKDKRIKVKKQENQFMMEIDDGIEEEEDEEEGEEDDEEEEDEDDYEEENDQEDDEYSYEENTNNKIKKNSYYDDYDEDERMRHNIMAARQLSIHEGDHHHHQQYYEVFSSLSSPPPPPHARSHSMISNMDITNHHSIISNQNQQHQHQHYHSYQHQGEWGSLRNETLSSPPSTSSSSRPRRHTADVSVLDRAPWGNEFSLSMGVDAVEAATVLTLLKRS